MKTLIAGSRGISDYAELEKAIQESKLDITEVISGHCPNSPDILGERWATKNKIKLKLYPANWKVFGKSAGAKRNEEMVKEAEQAIILWDGKSSGTKHTLRLCHHKKIPVYFKVIKND